MSMAQATVGVIGHVNHGKTRLVKALSGIDTDRLEEEKRRGMSIVLGFAHLPLAQGMLDLVDVPGHEQFVRTMVAGATGVRASLLVVDAREGIRPQTVEHLAIADLVGVPRGVVALTKADLVDAPRRAELQAELQRFLRGTHLESAPQVTTSAATGEGLDALRQALGALLQRTESPAAAAGRFYLPVDRVFSLRGHGTVATGTLRGGSLRVGDVVACMPGGLQATVRQLQVHNQPAAQAFAGQRVGVNLRHLKAADMARGDVLAPPGLLQPASVIEVELRLVPGTAPERLDGLRVRLLFGTTEVGAGVRVLGPAPGGRLFARLRCLRPVVAMAGEAFILRRESPPATLGGGRILELAPARARRHGAAALDRLRALSGGGADALLLERLTAAGTAGVPLARLADQAGLPAVALAEAGQDVAWLHEGRLWHRPLVLALHERMLQALRAYHEAHPLRAAAPLSVCRNALPRDVPDALWRLALRGLEDDVRVRCRAGLARLAGHDPLQALDAAGRAELAALLEAFRQGGMQPPDPPGASAPALRRALFELLVARGDILLLPGQPPAQKVAFHRDALQAAQIRLNQAYAPPAGFTVSQARELLASTRKFIVPLLEHLHATGQTRRRGDQHVFAQMPIRGGD